MGHAMDCFLRFLNCCVCVCVCGTPYLATLHSTNPHPQKFSPDSWRSAWVCERRNTSFSCVIMPRTITSPTLAVLPRRASTVFSCNMKSWFSPEHQQRLNTNQQSQQWGLLMFTWNLFLPSSGAEPITGGVKSSCLCVRCHTDHDEETVYYCH